jgi:hypothetical protein
VQTSDQINELAAALAKAQSEMGGAVKDSANPFFKSKYADLSSVMDACRPALSKHGIAVVQSPRAEGAIVSLDTLLIHSSGQWIRGTATTTAKDDSPQSLGSAITYLRRYALQSFAGVAPEDDDAEAAQGRGNGQTAKPTAVPTAPKGYQDWLDDMVAVVSEGTARLQAAWTASKPEYRQFLTATNAKQWNAMKDAAAKVKAAS